MRWGMRFFKNECNEGDRKFLLEMGESQEWGGSGFKMGEWEIFNISLHRGC